MDEENEDGAGVGEGRIGREGEVREEGDLEKEDVGCCELLLLLRRG